MMIAGFDVGTTAVKGVYFDVASGRVMAQAIWEYPVHRPRAGHAEQDPDDWLTGLRECHAALQRACPSAAPGSIGICSQVNTHVFVDRDLGHVLPAISWQDQRCADVAAELDGAVGEDRERIFGGPFTIDASCALSRAVWVQRHEPDAWQRTAWILSPKDYCIAQLTGTVVTDRISPVGLVGADGRYLEDALALVEGARERLPMLADFDALAGVTDGRSGLPGGVPVSVGTMDAWSSVYGSGVVEGGQGVEISGTSEIVGLMARHPGSAEGVISFPPVRGRFLHAGPTQAGGDALRWIAAILGFGVDEALARAAVATPQPLVFLPHLAGERAPLWNSDARSVFLGITSSTDPGALVRAVLEGVAHAARQLREACEVAARYRASTLRLSGGGAQSALWNQIKADAHQCELERVASLLTGCVGAALMGGVAAGVETDLESWAARTVAVSGRYEPDAAGAARLDDLHAIYRSTYQALQPQFVALRRARS